MNWLPASSLFSHKSHDHFCVVRHAICRLIGEVGKPRGTKPYNVVRHILAWFTIWSTLLTNRVFFNLASCITALDCRILQLLCPSHRYGNRITGKVLINVNWRTYPKVLSCVITMIYSEVTKYFAIEIRITVVVKLLTMVISICMIDVAVHTVINMHKIWFKILLSILLWIWLHLFSFDILYSREYSLHVIFAPFTSNAHEWIEDWMFSSCLFF